MYMQKILAKNRKELPPSTRQLLKTGASKRTRTVDLLVTNELLYQLSHGSICDRVQPMYG